MIIYGYWYYLIVLVIWLGYVNVCLYYGFYWGSWVIIGVGFYFGYIFWLDCYIVVSYRIVYYYFSVFYCKCYNVWEYYCW